MILFTDGLPGNQQGGDPQGNSREATQAYTATQNIKENNQDVTIYSVGYGAAVDKYFHWNNSANTNPNATCIDHSWWPCYKGIKCSDFLTLISDGYYEANADNLKQISHRDTPHQSTNTHRQAAAKL